MNVLYVTGVLLFVYIFVVCGILYSNHVAQRFSLLNKMFSRGFSPSAINTDMISKIFVINSTSAKRIESMSYHRFIVEENNNLNQTSMGRHSTYEQSTSNALESVTMKTVELPTSSTTTKSKFLLCTGTMGRLGNHLFEFASGYGIAAKKDMLSVIRQKGLVDSIFELKNDSRLLLLPDLKECKTVPKRFERWCSRYDPRLENFTVNSNLWIGWGLQSWKYFNDSYRELREQLTFRKHIRDKVVSIQEGILKKFNFTSRSDVTFIGVHIRRGDMLTDPLGYDVATPEYLSRAVTFFQNYSNTVFTVCTLDLEWSKQYMPKNIKVEFIVGNSPEVDMALLAFSDHVIQTVGTFSWWSSWLNNGTVIYYKWPAKEGGKLRKTFSADYSDYFLPHWIGM